MITAIILTSAFVTAMSGQASIYGGPNGSVQFFTYSYYNGVAVCPYWEADLFPTEFAAIEPYTTVELPLPDTVTMSSTYLAYTVPVTSSSDTVTFTIPAKRQFSGFDINPTAGNVTVAMYTAAGVRFLAPDTYTGSKVTPVTLDEAFSNSVSTIVKVVRTAGTGSVIYNFKIW